jgi:hypothetical protein
MSPVERLKAKRQSNIQKQSSHEETLSKMDDTLAKLKKLTQPIGPNAKPKLSMNSTSTDIGPNAKPKLSTTSSHVDIEKPKLNLSNAKSKSIDIEPEVKDIQMPDSLPARDKMRPNEITMKYRRGNRVIAEKTIKGLERLNINLAKPSVTIDVSAKEFPK